MMYPYGYGYGGFGWGAMLAMGLFGLLIIAGLVLLIVWAVRAGEHQHRGYYYGAPQQRDAAVQAARERYARGEISKEQYDEIMRNLGYPPSAPPSAPAAT